MREKIEHVMLSKIVVRIGDTQRLLLGANILVMNLQVKLFTFMNFSSGSGLVEAFWGAIRHGSIKLNIHIPSDPFIPVQRGMHAHNRVICGDGEE